MLLAEAKQHLGSNNFFFKDSFLISLELVVLFYIHLYFEEFLCYLLIRNTLCIQQEVKKSQRQQ